MAQRYNIVECTFQNGSKLYWKKKKKKRGGEETYFWSKTLPPSSSFARCPPLKNFIVPWPLQSANKSLPWCKSRWQYQEKGIKIEPWNKKWHGSLPNCSLKTCTALLGQINLFMKVRDNFFLYSEEFMGTKKRKESSKDSLYCLDDGPSKSIFYNLRLCLLQEMSFTQP